MVFAPFRTLVLPAALGASLLLPAPAQGQERRLASRALFAALDSTALEDSSAMLPLDPHAPVDSLMLGMLAFLDSGGGLVSTGRPTRIRRWNGFHTQAHPVAGILVDEDEIAGLLDKLSSFKGGGGVPREGIARRVRYVALFLVAHEYGHLLQYGHLGVPAVSDPKATRVVECGADLLGGIHYRQFLARHPGPLAIRAAAPVAVDFGYLVGGSDWLDGTDYPLQRDRRQCIQRGIDVAAGLEALDAVRTGRDDSSTAAATRRLEEAEPDLAAGRADLVDWSQERARALVSSQSVVDSSAVLAVVRMPLGPVVERLAEAASRGSRALQEFRSGRAPGGEQPGRCVLTCVDRGHGLEYLLRDALPLPWQCTIGERDGAETAMCTRDVDARATGLDRLVRQVQAALGPGWRRIERQYIAVFVPAGTDPRDVHQPRVELIENEVTSSDSPTSQLVVTVYRSLILLVRAGQ